MMTNNIDRIGRKTMPTILQYVSIAILSQALRSKFTIRGKRTQAAEKGSLKKSYIGGSKQTPFREGTGCHGGRVTGSRDFDHITDDIFVGIGPIEAWVSEFYGLPLAQMLEQVVFR